MYLLIYTHTYVMISEFLRFFFQNESLKHVKLYTINGFQ